MPDDKEITLQDCIDNAVEELEDRIEDGLLDEPYAEDALHEIADSHVPIYTYDVFRIAAESPDARAIPPILGWPIQSAVPSTSFK